MIGLKNNFSGCYIAVDRTIEINISEPSSTNKTALFNLAFRPFFLGAAAFSVIAILLWTASYKFGLKIQPYGLSANTWHAHEMIYGYSLAVVAGFLLTAIKNWSGMQTLRGFPLMLLFLLWIAARILTLFSGQLISIKMVAIIDNLFIVLLVISAMYPLIKARQWINLSIVSLLWVLLVSNIVFYLGLLGHLDKGVQWGLFSGLYFLLTMIFIMARRVISFFIEKGVGYSIQLKNWQWLDISSLIIFILFWVTDLFIDNKAIVSILATILFCLHSIRMIQWHTPGIWKKPLLWVLYVAYAFITIGFALKTASYLFEISPSLATHAWTYGGIGLMTIGMMARVALGHTGRNVFEPPKILFWCFTILFSGAVIRVFFPLFDTGHYTIWIVLSQILWLLSFSIFLWVYTPILINRRVDGKAG